MKNVLVFLVMISLIIVSSFNVQAETPPAFSKYPPTKLAKKIRIGYLEGGPWVDYQAIFKTMIIRLTELGWLEQAVMPTLPDHEDTRTLWNWLATEVKSNYLEFPEDAYYSDDWDDNKAKATRKLLLHRLTATGDIDLMIAMGTRAGKALATDEHSVSTVVCSSSDPLRAGIIKSIDDSGYEHVTARVDPTRYKRQIEAFHDVFNFKRLGMAFSNTVDGRSYAGVDDVIAASKLRNFEIVECHTIDDVPDVQLSNDSIIKCARELAPKIDAFYMTVQNGLNHRSLPVILKPMNQHKIPTFAQLDNGMVARGVLMSVADKSYARTEGFFNADNMARILNGAKPGDLNQRNEEPVKIVFNKEAARVIDLDENIYRLLSDVADEVYDTVEISTAPTLATPSKKWRLGYLEGGDYENYVKNLKQTIKALADLGWLKVEVSGAFKTITDTRTLWLWLAENTTGNHISFQKSAYYSNDWDSQKRKRTKKTLLDRLNYAKDIDMMIAMGTWAGLDLANTAHGTPTVVFSTSEPLRAGIIKSVDKSGLDHLVARIDPTRYPRQLQAFHDAIGFKKLGVAFPDTDEGRSYAALDDIQAVAQKRDFEIIECFTQSDVPDTGVAEKSVIACARELAGKIDAFYLTAQGGVTANNLQQILGLLHQAEIPTFSQRGIAQVEQGVLMTVATKDDSLWGRFQAELMGKIMNGAKPGELSGALELPVKITFNADTALKIGLDARRFNLLYETADVVIENNGDKK